MKRVVVITTTINLPHVLNDYVEPEDIELTIVVAGDVQTPPATREQVELLDGVYIDTTSELATRWRTHQAVGLRSIQRRNLALLHAITLGPDVIITVDDDNYPLHPHTFIEDFVLSFQPSATYVTSTETGWFDPGRLCSPPTVQRGFPLDQRHLTHKTTRKWERVRDVAVVQGLVIGDPDVDAIERLVNAPDVLNVSGNTILARGTWAPFNTQNTAFTYEVSPLFQVLVGVGRYDDIWASYVARRVLDDLGLRVRYGYPLVEQTRNAHNLIADLRAELFGYEWTPALVQRLRSFKTSGTVVERLTACYDRLADLLPEMTVAANDAWLFDVTEALAEGDKIRG